MTADRIAKRRHMQATEDHVVEAADTLRISCPLPTTMSADKPAPVCIERINDRELMSIYALLAYVSYNQNVRQETVQMIVEAEFGVDHVAKIRRDDYMRAIEFLVDLKMGEVIN